VYYETETAQLETEKLTTFCSHEDISGGIHSYLKAVAAII